MARDFNKSKQIIEPTLLGLHQIVADLLAMLGRLIGEDVKVVYFELFFAASAAAFSATRAPARILVSP